MLIKKFEDCLAWQSAKELTTLIYSTLKTCRDYGYKDQMQRATISIMNNIAEGFERKSDKEFAQFLYIAKGSCGEVRSMSYPGEELGYFDHTTAERIKSLVTKIAQLLFGFIRKL